MAADPQIQWQLDQDLPPNSDFVGRFREPIESVNNLELEEKLMEE